MMQTAFIYGVYVEYCYNRDVVFLSQEYGIIYFDLVVITHLLDSVIHH